MFKNFLVFKYFKIDNIKIVLYCNNNNKATQNTRYCLGTTVMRAHCSDVSNDFYREPSGNWY